MLQFQLNVRCYCSNIQSKGHGKPEETISFSKMPIIEPLPVVEMSQANCDLLRDWASPYGAAVRQPTVCQETTMAKHATLPENMYHRQCIVLDRPVTFVTRHV